MSGLAPLSGARSLLWRTSLNCIAIFSLLRAQRASVDVAQRSLLTGPADSALLKGAHDLIALDV